MKFLKRFKNILLNLLIGRGLRDLKNESTSPLHPPASLNAAFLCLRRSAYGVVKAADRSHPRERKDHTEFADRIKLERT